MTTRETCTTTRRYRTRKTRVCTTTTTSPSTTWSSLPTAATCCVAPATTQPRFGISKTRLSCIHSQDTLAACVSPVCSCWSFNCRLNIVTNSDLLLMSNWQYQSNHCNELWYIRARCSAICLPVAIRIKYTIIIV